MTMGRSRDERVFQSLNDMPDETMRQFVDAMLEGMISQEISIDKCGTIDSYVALLAPLPPETMAKLLALTAGLTSKDKNGKVGSFRIC